MKRATLFVTSLSTITALLFPGCSDLPPGQTGPFTDGAVAGGQFARATTVTSAEAFATGSTTGTVATAAIVILAKHQATARQREVAVARAKVAIAKIKTRQARAAASKSEAGAKKTAGTKKAPGAEKTAGAKKAPGAEKTAGAKKAPGAEKAPAVEKTAVAKTTPPAKKLPRYIAVDTVKDERTVPQAEKSVIIFDTETEEIVGNNVYDVKSTPPVGGTAKFETYTAEYVGSGG